MLDAHFKINAILNFCFFSKGHKFGKMSCHVAQIFTIECIPCAKINMFSEDFLEMMFSVGKIELKVKVGSRKNFFGAQEPFLEYLSSVADVHTLMVPRLSPDCHGGHWDKWNCHTGISLLRVTRGGSAPRVYSEISHAGKCAQLCL